VAFPARDVREGVRGAHCDVRGVQCVRRVDEAGGRDDRRERDERHGRADGAAGNRNDEDSVAYSPEVDTGLPCRDACLDDVREDGALREDDGVACREGRREVAFRMDLACRRPWECLVDHHRVMEQMESADTLLVRAMADAMESLGHLEETPIVLQLAVRQFQRLGRVLLPDCLDCVILRDFAYPDCSRRSWDLHLHRHCQRWWATAMRQVAVITAPA